MALIGQIAISMTANTEKLAKGLKVASAAINSFGAKSFGKLGDFFSPVIAAIKATGASLEYVFRPIEDIIGATKNWGKYLFSVIKTPVAGFAKDVMDIGRNWGKALSYIYGPAVSAGFKTINHLMSSIGKVAQVSFQAVAWGAKASWEAIKGLGAAAAHTYGFVKELASKLLVFGTVVGGIVAISVANIVKGAIAMGEQFDRAKIIFGQFTTDVIKEATLMGTAFGVSRKEFVAAASAFGTIFQGVGYTDEAASKLSIHFVKLATDLSSLVHIPVQEAMEKIQSGLAGQVRPLREVGVFMSDDLIKTYAYTHGIAKLNAELTESQKVQARVGFITQSLSKANGNLAATAEGAGNSVRGLMGRFENLKDSIGTALLGFIVPALQEANIALEAIQTSWQASGFAANDAAIGVLGGVEKQVEAVGWLQKSIMFVANAWQIVDIGFLSLQLKVTQGVLTMAQTFGGFAEGLSRIIEKFTGMKMEAGAFANAWIEDLTRITEAQQKTLDEKRAAPWASDTVNKAFVDARKKIEDARAELAKPGIDVSKFAPVGAAEAAAAIPKFANAAARGSQEGANAELRARFGGGVGNTPADMTAKNTAETVKAVKDLPTQIVQGLARIIGGGERNPLIAFGNF